MLRWYTFFLRDGELEACVPGLEIEARELLGFPERGEDTTGRRAVVRSVDLDERQQALYDALTQIDLAMGSAQTFQDLIRALLPLGFKAGRVIGREEGRAVGRKEAMDEGGG